jgi:hypothetical protein
MRNKEKKRIKKTRREKKGKENKHCLVTQLEVKPQGSAK